MSLPPLPRPFAMTVSTHTDENGEKTAHCILYADHPGPKQKLYTEDQMRDFALAHAKWDVTAMYTENSKLRAELEKERQNRTLSKHEVMLREAVKQAMVSPNREPVWQLTPNELEHFATLVRAQALEDAAQEAHNMLTAGRSPLGDLVAKAIRALKSDSKPLGGEG